MKFTVIGVLLKSLNRKRTLETHHDAIVPNLTGKKIPDYWDASKKLLADPTRFLDRWARGLPFCGCSCTYIHLLINHPKTPTIPTSNPPQPPQL